MFNRLARQSDGQPRSGTSRKPYAFSRSAGLLLLAVLAGLLLLLQPACLFKKHKTAAPAVPPTIVRIVYLPLNPSTENPDVRWVALAVPALLTKLSESAPDLETVPFWEMMPITLEAAGNSRIITDQTAAYIASRVTAKWATQGEFSPARKGEVQLTVDFIPTKPTTVPFRYEKTMNTESLGKNFFDAIEQFLRYLVARPLPRGTDKSFNGNSFKAVAEALDREYGWFVPAEPGKAGKVVENLIHSDVGLARLLFNPSVYPSLTAPAKPSKAKPKTVSPPAVPPPAAPPAAGQSVNPHDEVKPQKVPETASSSALPASSQLQDRTSLPTEATPPSTPAAPGPKSQGSC